MYKARTSGTPAPASSHRRRHLIAAIRQRGGTVTSSDAARICAAHGYDRSRNTARLDLHALAEQGELVFEDCAGRRTYRLPGGDCRG